MENKKLRKKIAELLYEYKYSAFLKEIRRMLVSIHCFKEKERDRMIDVIVRKIDKEIEKIS